MQIVYLDQNMWIELAKIRNGLVTDEAGQHVLAKIQTATEMGRLHLPLSSIHYLEVGRIRDAARRQRLGEVMWELSCGTTLASYRAILTNELETALAKRFPQVIPRPFTLLSTGVFHAFGMEPAPYRLPPELRTMHGEAAVARLEASLNMLIQKSLITGQGPKGLQMKPFTNTEHNVRFQNHLDALHPRLSELPHQRRDDALQAMSVVDILDTLNEVIRTHGLTPQQVTPPGSEKETMAALMQEIPSRRVDLHLHRQVLRNPALQSKRSDLEDWAGLGPAAAHCDVVVCEKHFADLLLRDGFRPKALVLTDIRALRIELGV